MIRNEEAKYLSSVEWIHSYHKKKNIPRNLHFVRAIEKNLRNLALKRLKLQALISIQEIKFSKTGITIQGPRTISSRTDVGFAFGELEWITWRSSGVFFVGQPSRDLSTGSPPGLTDGTNAERWLIWRMTISRRLKRLRGYPVHGIHLFWIRHKFFFPLFSTSVSLKVKKKKKIVVPMIFTFFYFLLIFFYLELAYFNNFFSLFFSFYCHDY